MVTLTYADANAWSPGHVKSYLQNLRKWLQRRSIPCRYVWVAEIQTKRYERTGSAVLHYHVVVWVPVGLVLPRADDSGWWPHGMTRTEVARDAVGYLMHYLKKGKASELLLFPRGCRAYGVGGLPSDLGRARRWLSLPGFVQARSDTADDWNRHPGGGWVDPDGQWWPSEFVRTTVGRAGALLRVRDHGRPFEAAGPFTWLRALHDGRPADVLPLRGQLA